METQKTFSTWPFYIGVFELIRPGNHVVKYKLAEFIEAQILSWTRFASIPSSWSPKCFLFKVPRIYSLKYDFSFAQTTVPKVFLHAKCTCLKNIRTINSISLY